MNHHSLLALPFALLLAGVSMVHAGGLEVFPSVPGLPPLEGKPGPGDPGVRSIKHPGC